MTLIALSVYTIVHLSVAIRYPLCNTRMSSLIIYCRLLIVFQLRTGRNFIPQTDLDFRWIWWWLPLQRKPEAFGLQHGAMHIVSYLKSLTKYEVFLTFYENKYGVRKTRFKARNPVSHKALFISIIPLACNLILLYSNSWAEIKYSRLQ